MSVPDLSIFISYRRDDTAGHAAHLKEDLEDLVGDGHVWLDIVGIKPGVNWKKAIDDQLAKCDVALVVVGRWWLQSKDGPGHRIEQKGDVHRHEIETALNRGILTIPVLVDGAPVPSVGDLPQSIQGLFDVQSFTLSTTGFRQGVAELVGVITDLRASQPERLKQSPSLTGKEIYDRLERSDDPPELMSRKGGLRGGLLNEDISTGRWADHVYPVSHEIWKEPPKGWFRPPEFRIRIDRWNAGTTAGASHQSPAAPLEASSEDEGQGGAIAAELRRLEQRGILVTAAERGELTKLACMMDECLCPGGREYFDKKTQPASDWAPSLDHHPILDKDGGQRVIGNVRLAHVLCNRVDYAKMTGKVHAKDRARAAAESADWAKNHPQTPG